MWGLNSRPWYQESHALPAEPAGRPMLGFFICCQEDSEHNSQGRGRYHFSEGRSGSFSALQVDLTYLCLGAVVVRFLPPWVCGAGVGVLTSVWVCCFDVFLWGCTGVLVFSFFSRLSLSYLKVRRWWTWHHWLRTAAVCPWPEDHTTRNEVRWGIQQFQKWVAVLRSGEECRRIVQVWVPFPGMQQGSLSHCKFKDM